MPYNSIALAASIKAKVDQGLYDHADQPSTAKRKRIRTCTLVEEQSREYREKLHYQRQKRSNISTPANNVEEENNDNNSDDETLAQFPARLNRKNNTFTLVDSSSEDESEDEDKSSKEYNRQNLVMKRRKENMDACKWIQDDIDGSTNQLARGEGTEFNLVEAMRMVEQQEDNEGSDVEEIRGQIQRRYDKTQRKRNQQIASRLEADKISTISDPLFDAELSDGEDDRLKQPAISLAVKGSNNNISINISQHDGKTMQSHTGYNNMMYRPEIQSVHPPYSYHGGQYPIRIDESTQRIHHHSSYPYNITPRFLAAGQSSRRPANTVSRIEAEVSRFRHLLTENHLCWVGKLIYIARLIDCGMPLTHSQRTWVYNTRARYKEHEWKGALIRIL